MPNFDEKNDRNFVKFWEDGKSWRRAKIIHVPNYNWNLSNLSEKFGRYAEIRPSPHESSGAKSIVQKIRRRKRCNCLIRVRRSIASSPSGRSGTIAPSQVIFSWQSLWYPSLRFPRTSCKVNDSTYFLACVFRELTKYRQHNFSFEVSLRKKNYNNNNNVKHCKTRAKNENKLKLPQSYAAT